MAAPPPKQAADARQAAGEAGAQGRQFTMAKARTGEPEPPLNLIGAPKN
jgi:hypothetical protein